MNVDRLILALLDIKGIGPRTVKKLISGALTSGITELQEFFDWARMNKVRVPEVSANDLQRAWANASRILEKCEASGTTYIHRWSPGFPELLKNIPNAPVNLFAQGNQSILQQASVAVVGTRSPTDFGFKSAYKIGARAVECGFVVVSGLAEGCDTGGHLGALDAMGKTVAVLAHGFGTIYPPSNRSLAERILNANGCLLTEYPPGSPTHPIKFIERDRLQSGLSNGTIVIETDVAGGTMQTVGCTIAQGRMLGALQHPERFRAEPKVQGNQKLIKEGKAIALETESDLMGFLKKSREP